MAERASLLAADLGGPTKAREYARTHRSRIMHVSSLAASGLTLLLTDIGTIRVVFVACLALYALSLLVAPGRVVVARVYCLLLVVFSSGRLLHACFGSRAEVSTAVANNSAVSMAIVASCIGVSDGSLPVGQVSFRVTVGTCMLILLLLLSDMLIRNTRTGDERALAAMLYLCTGFALALKLARDDADPRGDASTYATFPRQPADDADDDADDEADQEMGYTESAATRRWPESAESPGAEVAMTGANPVIAPAAGEAGLSPSTGGEAGPSACGEAGPSTNASAQPTAGVPTVVLPSFAALQAVALQQAGNLAALQRHERNLGRATQRRERIFVASQRPTYAASDTSDRSRLSVQSSDDGTPSYSSQRSARHTALRRASRQRRFLPGACSPS